MSELSFELNPKVARVGTAPPAPSGPVVPPLVGYTRELAVRKLAALTGWCAHAPLLLQRGALGSQMRRQAARYGDDLEDFVRERAPRLTALRMDAQSLEQNPLGAGRAVVLRGHRLLLGTVAAEGAAPLERVRRKLPHRLAGLRLPTLNATQRAQVEELMLLCIVPERLPQWDWLF